MENLVPDFINQLSLFKSHHGGIKEIVDITNPEHRYVVIDELPNRFSATYCIHTSQGWIVFSKEYSSQTTVKPLIYGILFKKMDIDLFSEASLKGMDIGDIYKICEEIENGNDVNTNIGLGNS